MIAVVEDDKSISELICYALSAVGMECVSFSSGEELYKSISQLEQYELILLDVMLPGDDGLSILKRLRTNKSTEDIPIIMLTALSTELDKVKGLDLGADDYITKPFGVMELVSRVKARLRRNMPKVRTLRCGDIVIDNDSHTVSVAGKNIQLTLKEYSLLRILMENIGRVMTRDVLLREIWGYDFDAETRTVDVHIRSLRTKLGDSANELVTVRGVGYKMGGGHD